MEWGQEKLVCICSMQTQPLQATHEGHASRNVTCFLSVLDLSLVENVDIELRVVEPPAFPDTSSLLMHALVTFTHAQDFLPRF